MFQCCQPVLRTILALVCLFAPYGYSQGSTEAELERYSQEGQKALTEARYSDAERAYEKLRDLDPEVAEIHANLGLIYFQEKKFDQAIPSLRHALKLNPGLPKLDTLLAMSLSELGQYHEALPGLDKGFHRSGGSCDQADVRPAAGEGLQLVTRRQQGGGGRAGAGSTVPE